MGLPEKKQHYTYADYCAWNDDDGRWELIGGVPCAMSPAPSRKHQEALMEIAGQFRDFLKGKPCRVFPAPFDVRLNGLGDGDDDVFQPDIVVVCNDAKLDDKGCNGAPDVVIEILSPSTAMHDKVLKFNAYQRSGVREYWIVDPDSKTVQAHILENGRYFTESYGEADTIAVHVLKGCEINLAEVFAG